jgi:hypothetical protein
VKKVPKLWRLRAHPPTFDWAEARRRAKRGETHYAIAKDMGVDRRSVDRVVKMSPRHVTEAMKMTDPDVRQAMIQDRGKVPCPRCGRPMSKDSTHCRDCTNELRLEDAPVELVRVAGIRQIELRNVSRNRVVKVDDRWGVTCGLPRGESDRNRIVDFWDGGREYVPAKSLVEVAPSSVVVIAGEVQEDEPIE